MSLGRKKDKGGSEIGAIQWPVPEKVEWLEMFTYAYHHDVLLMIPLKLSTDVKPGEYELKGKVELMAVYILFTLKFWRN